MTDSPKPAAETPEVSGSFRLREALEETERSFREVIDGVEDYAIFLLDREGRVASWNAGAQRIKGWAAQEILGRHFSAFYAPEAAASGWPDYELAQAVQHGRFEDEGWRVRKDGSRFWANVVITALPDRSGQAARFLKITRDLTDRRQAEQSLRESEERFRLLIDGVQDYAIVMLSPDGLVTSWNQGAERVKGYKPGEILGQHFSRFYLPEAIAQGKPAWELRAAAEHGRIEDEGWRIRKDGTRFWANVVITALYGREGQLRGFAKVTRDMTERRRIEELEQADRQKNEFLAMLAHELRNPLAPIRSAIHIMSQPSASRAQTLRARDIGERQVEYMANLLEDLIDVARIAQGTLELRAQPVRAAVAFTAAVEAIRSVVQDRQQRLNLEMPHPSLWIRADPVRLQQVLINLLGNASKYTPPGGDIWFEARRDGGEVALCVRDAGIGIEPAMLPRIFDLFVQADRRVDRAVGGVGIGLTLVKKLAELQGGRVDAFSAGLGKGSEFVVHLPAVKAPAVEGNREEREPQAPGAAVHRILIVDDNVDAAEGLAVLLELDGHEVRRVLDGPSALAAAESFRPEVVLLDIGLPGMDGYEVARRLRLLPAAAKALIVAVTGWGQETDKHKSRDAGMDHHLIKPIDPAALRHLLSEHRPPER